MKKHIFILISAAWCSMAYAVCPLCTIAVGMGVGLAKWLGIDDAITGLWIGGLTISLIIWTVMWFDKKKFKFFGYKIIIILAYYIIIVAPLFYIDVIGHPANVLWGYDKLLLGIIIGSIFFLLATGTHLYLKKHNNNHAYFPFHKVVLPVSSLAILSGIFYLVTS